MVVANAATAAHAGAPGGAPAFTCHDGNGEVKINGEAGDKPALGTSAKSVDDEERQERRRKRHGLLDWAARLLPAERVHHCQRTPAGSAVAVVKTAAGARFSGLQVCGSVWHCPLCSRVVSATRRDEMNRLLRWARTRGFVPLLLTLTGRHRRADPLPQLLEGMKSAKKRFHQSRDWRAIKGQIGGHVTATELTHGRNGWHLHYHALLLVDAADEEAAKALLQGLRTVWERALAREGLDCNSHGFDLQGASHAGDYVAKWGAAEELTLSGSKKSRDRDKGRTVWELLAEAAEGDAIAAARWREYALAFKGRRQLVWSRGLKAMAGIKERTDEEIAAAAEAASIHEPSQEIGRLSAFEWRSIVRAGLRVAMLEAVERQGKTGFQRILALIRSS